MSLKRLMILGVCSALAVACANGTEVSGDTTGESSSVSDESNESSEAQGLPVEDSCDGSTLYERSEDPGEFGPWPVGAKTVDVAGLTGEIWYPAVLGSEAGLETEVYDVRVQLAPEEGAKVSDEKNPWHYCDCYRDLPLDVEHGPYPVIVFVTPVDLG